MSQPRRIVLIMTDTQGTNVVGCYGVPGVQTERLDGLAAQGMRFDHCFCAQPVCTPARGALFTGLYPHSNGAMANDMGLCGEVPHLGQRLQAAGLRTAYIGKWHLDAFDYFGTGSAPDGWDPAAWYDMRNYLDELTPEERQRSRSWNRDPDHPVTSDFTFAHRCSDRAIDFLDRHSDEEFCLVVSYDEPHGPHLVPEEWEERFADFELPRSPNLDDDLTDKPAYQREFARAMNVDRTKPIKNPRYFGCNAFVDHQIGRVIDAVDRHCPDALVIFTSDHGYFLNAHGLYGKGCAVYDEAARVPLIVRWPDHIAAGSTHAPPVSHVDIVPTLLDYAGCEIPETIQGESILKRMTNEQRDERLAYIEFNRFGLGAGFGGFLPMRAVTDGRYKLAIHLLDSDELYDTQADPHECTNRIDDPELANVRDRLHEAILQWQARTLDPLASYHWEARPWNPDAPTEGWWNGDGRDRPDPPLRDGMRVEPVHYSTGLPREY